jgi:hypothetical protein
VAGLKIESCFISFTLSEVKSYFSESLPYITNQTIHHCDTAPSVMETMATELTEQQEWENEWNQVGLPSRLSEEVS